MTTANAADPLLQPSQEPPRPPPRPNYGKIHAKPLPLTTYPLPPLIPHNPISFLHIAVVYLYHLWSQPSSHPEPLLKAHWSAETSSVHVTDESTARALWEGGFFGKGSLSRSEPSWLDREKKRKGLVANETSEEFTRQRREERKKFKQERAKKEREAIEEKLKEERRSRASSGAPEPTARARFEGMNGGAVDNLADSIEAFVLREPSEPPSPTAPTVPPAPDSVEAESPSPTLQLHTNSDEMTPQDKLDAAAAIINQEHLQLTPPEAFFLAYALGTLSIHDPSTSLPIPPPALFTLFRSHSHFPPLPPTALQPDDPFLLSYTTYHHFRSLGWVVRPGLKFAVDYLLYLRGPVFSHAEFATIILPAYTDPYWRSTPELERATRRKEGRSWWWVHCKNRVQSQVRKSLVLVYVEVPGPERLAAAEGEGEMDIGAFLKEYKVRELGLKRWIPNRERD